MFFGMDPEEYRKQMEERELNNEAHRHDMHEWIESLDEHGLKMLRSLLYDYSDHTSAAYLIGFAGLVMQKKFNICAACGKNHDDITVEDVIGKSHEGNSAHVGQAEPDYGPDGTPLPPASGTIKDPMPQRGDTVTHGKAFEEMSGPELLATVPKKVQDQMDEYRLDFIEFQWPKVLCKGCGMEYVSLEDRMLKAPGIEGCTGCSHKGAWG